MNVGERIRIRRLELGLTQLELSKRMGYTSKAAICKVEKGQDNLTMDRIIQFAKALECDPDWLMGYKSSRPIPDVAPGTAELIDLYSRATPEQRQAVINLLRSFVSDQNNN